MHSPEPGTATRVTSDKEQRCCVGSADLQSHAGNLPHPLVTRLSCNAQDSPSLGCLQVIQTDEFRKCALNPAGLALEHELDHRFGWVAGFAGLLQLIEVFCPQLFLAQAQLLKVFPSEQAAVMAVVEGQFQCILAGRFQATEADVDLAELQDGVAVALDLGGGRVHAQEFGGQVVDLAGCVGEAEGLGGFVQVDGGWQRS